MNMPIVDGTYRQTDGRHTVTLRFLVNAASIRKAARIVYKSEASINEHSSRGPNCTKSGDHQAGIDTFFANILV